MAGHCRFAFQDTRQCDRPGQPCWLTGASDAAYNSRMEESPTDDARRDVQQTCG